MITPELILEAYRHGLFPMAETRETPYIHWVEPEMRGILPLDNIHIPRRLKRKLRTHPWQVKVDKNFPAVICACAEQTQTREQSWINEGIISLYTELFNRGYAHSVEVWDENILVAGLYGLAIGAAFFGESMFTRVTDGSKIALMYLIARLKLGSFQLLDTQFITDHLKQFGAIEISQSDYLTLLEPAIDAHADFYSPGKGGGTSEVILQSINQTS